MTRSMVLLAVVAMSVAPAAAFNRPKQVPAREPLHCPEVGTGFVRIPDAGTCVRIGGSVRADAVVIKGGR